MTKAPSLNDKILSAFRAAIRAETEEDLISVLRTALANGVLNSSRVAAVAQKLRADQRHLLWGAAYRAASSLSCITENPTTGAAELVKTQVSTLILIGPQNLIEARVAECQKSVASAFYVAGVAEEHTPIGVWAAPYDLATLSKLSPQKIFEAVKGVTDGTPQEGAFPLPSVAPAGSDSIVARSILIFRYAREDANFTPDLETLDTFLCQVFGEGVAVKPVLYFEDAIREHLTAELLFLKGVEAAQRTDAAIHVTQEISGKQARFVFSADDEEIGLVRMPVEITDKCDLDQVNLDLNAEDMS